MNILMASMIMLCCVIGSGAQAKAESSQIQTAEAVGMIVAVDPKNSSFDLNYEVNDQTHDMQTATFFVTDITVIDIATVKSSLNDLKPGSSVLLEYAQMPDGTKVVESVWVKKP